MLKGFEILDKPTIALDWGKVGPGMPLLYNLFVPINCKVRAERPFSVKL